MPTSLVKQVADYCWSHDFLSVFRKFFADHASAFDGNTNTNTIINTTTYFYNTNTNTNTYFYNKL